MKKSSKITSLVAAPFVAAAALAAFASPAFAGPYSASIEQLCDGTSQVTLTATVETSQVGTGWTWDATVNGVLVADNALPDAVITVDIGLTSQAVVVFEFITPDGHSDGLKPPINLVATPPTNCETDTTVPQTAPDTTPPAQPTTTAPGEQPTTTAAVQPTTTANESQPPVTTAGVSSGTATATSGTLPATGDDPIMAIIGAIAVAGGAALLLVRRRPATD